MKRLLLVYDENIIFKEMIVSKHRCILAILIWLYIPDFTYKKKDYFIFDV